MVNLAILIGETQKSQAMSNFELATVIISLFAVIISIIAIYISNSSSNKSNEVQKNISRRSQVSTLADLWIKVSHIDPDNLIEPDVIIAVQALAYTAACWNHDVVEKEIIYQLVWGVYKDIYDTLDGNKTLVRSHNKMLKDFLTPEITKAYRELNDHQNNKVKSTKV